LRQKESIMARVSVVTLAALLASAPMPSTAQVVLTLDDVVARARERAPSVVIARARVGEGEAAVAGASARFRDNPSIDVAAGPRVGGGVGRADFELGVSQQFESGGQRQARIDGARAVVDRQRALADQGARRAVFDAASAFLRGIAAVDRIRMAEEAAAVSRDLASVAERRYGAGDIAAIDVNLARIDAARSASTVRAARADLLEATGALRALLSIPRNDALELRGSLDTSPVPPRDLLERALTARPEFAALAAELREADAEAHLGAALRRPDIGLAVRYAHEGDDTIVLGGMTVTLPAFQRGRGVVAVAAARAGRLRLEMETAREVALAELTTAVDVHQQRVEVAEALSAGALPNVADNEGLARRSYDAGELNLVELLFVRRDALDARTLIVERRLDAALSRLYVDYLAGVLR
jgi:cobalt-zinc-cadmium efflux system outer membrane protein